MRKICQCCNELSHSSADNCANCGEASWFDGTAAPVQPEKVEAPEYRSKPSNFPKRDR